MMLRNSDYVKLIAACAFAVVIVIGLGGCGNTVKGVGADIMKMGDKLMEKKEDEKTAKTLPKPVSKSLSPVLDSKKGQQI
tara:strand:- start:539 stop:778 length:240 start_codon:yes stop_codon:yes gene_type:complete